jgi:3',5'-cyclic AMP phosphodiesterase CpdA
MKRKKYKRILFFLLIAWTAVQLFSSPGGEKKREPGAPVIVVYGDTRSNHEAHGRIIDAILRVEPAVVFHTGDLVEHGWSASQWQTFNKITAPLRRKVKFYPAIGNHERNSPLYYDNFDLPGNERWYSVETGNIHFIVLDTMADISPGSRQYEWLSSDLQEIPDHIIFTIAIFHHPPFSTGPHKEDEKGLRQTIVPLFEQHGLDIAFTGHDHIYERSFYNGIYYIVTGGGGAPLYNRKRKSPHSQLFVKAFHFCKLTVSGTRLTVEVYGIDSALLDRFVVPKKNR